MTEQVDFYILPEARESAKLQVACKITLKAFDQGLRVYLRTQDLDQSAELDRMLWVFSQSSFIPHVITEGAETAWEDYPVQLGINPDPANAAEVLINLSDSVPEQFQYYPRIADLVGADEKAGARARYRHYRDRGIEPNTHNLG